MSRTQLCLFTWLTIMLVSGSAWADQPIFDEMPRWSGGWGFQLVEEYRTEGALISGHDSLRDDLGEEIHILHLEGVYTWHKSIRVTAKLPFVLDAQREVDNANGSKDTQNDDGFGDLTLALPLKHYFNMDGRTGSFTLNPQVKVPLGEDEGYRVYGGAWGQGLSLGYETETYDYHVGLELSGWRYQSERPSDVGGQLSLGLNFRALGTSGHLKWKTRCEYALDEILTVSAGPTLYWRFTDTVHGQIEAKHDVYEWRKTVGYGGGNSIRVGLGFVF